ncbi:hypothetical protein [Algirhabdus cladophorae]|uniref:hypothetical protein n=1 Tax=Algirhabdus cladophorae TaxID=3377108 RepID=UPI003B849CB9
MFIRVSLMALMLSLPAQALHADTASTVKAVIGKKLIGANDGEVRLRKNGKLNGKYRGSGYKGTWTLTGGEFCRKIPEFKLDGCQAVLPLKNSTGKLVGVEFRNPGQAKGNEYFLR